MNDPILTSTPGTKGSGRNVLALIGTVLLVGIALCASRSSLGPVPADDAKDGKPRASTPQAVAAANRFLDALDAQRRERALYEFGSARKPNWSNLPVSMVPRNGFRLGDLTREQQTLAMNVVAAVLSKSGYQKVVDIMDGDQPLAAGGGRGGGGRGGRGRGPGAMFGANKYSWPSSASHRRRSRGWCNSAAITWG
jgi:hypothetical protein